MPEGGKEPNETQQKNFRRMDIPKYKAKACIQRIPFARRPSPIPKIFTGRAFWPHGPRHCMPGPPCLDELIAAGIVYARSPGRIPSRASPEATLPLYASQVKGDVFRSFPCFAWECIPNCLKSNEYQKDKVLFKNQLNNHRLKSEGFL
jgi:hypothetical protein